MIRTVNQTIYKAFGLTISSDIPLPEVPVESVEHERDPDVQIQRTDLREEWGKESEPKRYFAVKEQFCMFEIPNVAIFKVVNGRFIFVSPLEGSEEDQIRLYLLGTCMGTILMQRAILPLHGSAVVIKGKAYAIVGESGAGKSTLASAFIQQGYTLLSDDVIPVTINNEGRPIITPAYPQQKLWKESLERFGMSSKSLRPIIKRENKFVIPVSKHFHQDRLPLAGVFELIPSTTDQPTISPINKLQRLHTLFSHTYRNFLIARSGVMDWHFSTTTKMVKQMNFYQIQRPISRFTAFELVDLILTKINKGEKSL